MITEISFIDWVIVAVFVLFLFYTTTTTKKYTKSVADFLSANRCAGRYLLGVSEGMGMYGIVMIIASVEMYTATGLTTGPWYAFFLPIQVFLLLSGWVLYRFRATRALTLGQFFEMRYSRRFRMFAGIIAWLAGIINFGIFPGIGARFFMMWFGIENYIVSIGSIEINLTLAVIMLVLLGLALFFTFTGGQIAVIVTDFWQGFFSGWIILAAIVIVLMFIGWDRISEALVIASKPGESLIDPIDISSKKDFNITFFLIVWFFAIYQQGSWQGIQGYNTSALTAHESKMGKVLGGLRSQYLLYIAFIAIALTGITLFNHPDFVGSKQVITDDLKTLFSSENTQRQLSSPAAFRSIMPKGMIGLFAIAMFGFGISTLNTLIHSWGSIFIQDILCPFRKKPFSQQHHLRLLRISIVFVTIFGFLFSLLFPLKEYILMFQHITVAIFVGGSGAVLIGGLYWKWGTTRGAWCAMITGCGLSAATIILRTAWEHIPFCVERWGSEFPINSMIMAFSAAMAGCIGYFVVSLLDNQKPADMDKLLNRGKYALETEEEELVARGATDKPIHTVWKLIGVNSHEFSRIDKVIFLGVFLVNVWFFGINFFLLVLGWLSRMTPKSWLSWHWILLGQEMFLAILFIVWLSIGGLIDLKRLYRKLKKVNRDLYDDGRVLSNNQFGKSSQDNEP